MPRTRRPNRTNESNVSSANCDEYTYDTLPEERKKLLQAKLDDLEREVENRIEAANTEVQGIAQSIRNAYRVAIFQLPKNQREMNLEALVLQNKKDKKEGLIAPRESLIVSTQLAKVAENVTETVKDKVSAVKKTTKKKFNEKESIEKEGDLRPLTSTAFTNRKCGKIPDSLQNLSAIMPVNHETPKMINQSVKRLMPRIAKPNELAVSLNGSPILMALDNITPKKQKAIDSILEFTNRTNLIDEKKEDESTDADMEALVKLQSVRAKIDSMRNMNDQ